MIFPSWLRGLTHGSASTPKKSRPYAVRTRGTRCRPSLERLEDRNLLAYDLGFAFGLGSTGIDSASAVAADAAGNVLVAGSFNSASLDLDSGPGTYLLSNVGGYDGYAAKYDPTGNLLWGIQIGGTGNGAGTEVASDGAGNVLIAGSFAGSVEIGALGQPHLTLTNGGSREGFLAKLDPAGNALWARTFGTAADPRLAYGITADAAGNVYATGSEGHRLFVAKYSADGGALWTKVVSEGTGIINAAGGTSYANGADLAVDASQNVYVAGTYQGTIDFNSDPKKANSLTSAGSRQNPSQDAFVLMLNATGTYVWSGSMGGRGFDYGQGIAIDGTGNVLVNGSFEADTEADFDPGRGRLNLPNGGGFVVKLDPNGNLIWGTGGVANAGIALDAAGNVYTTGLFGGTIDADPGPGIFNLTAGGTYDVLISKLNSAGKFVWAGALGGPGSGRAASSDIAVDGSGNIYTTGYFSGTADFDPGAGTYSLTATPDGNANLFSDAFVSKLVPSTTALAAAMAVPQSTPMVTVSGTQAVNSSVTISSTEDDRRQAERTEAADQAIAGLFGSEPRRRFSASHRLDFDADLFADIALSV